MNALKGLGEFQKKQKLIVVDNELWSNDLHIAFSWISIRSIELHN